MGKGRPSKVCAQEDRGETVQRGCVLLVGVRYSVGEHGAVRLQPGVVGANQHSRRRKVVISSAWASGQSIRGGERWRVSGRLRETRLYPVNGEKRTTEPWVLGGDYNEVFALTRKAAKISMLPGASVVRGKGLRSGGGW